MVPIVSIDGIDGSGKSTLATNLEASLTKCRLAPEFSDTEMGSFLKAKVIDSPHFIGKSELAQSLVFLAEYAEHMSTLHDASLDDPDNVQIIERGWLSKYAYQVCVLERRFSPKESREIVTAILKMIPRPNGSILLRVDEPTLRTRIAARSTVADDAYFSFLQRADELMVAAATHGHDTWVIDTSDMTVDEVCTVALPFVSAMR